MSTLLGLPIKSMIPTIIGVLIAVGVLAGCGGSSADAATPVASSVTNNSAAAGGFRISLLNVAEGFDAVSALVAAHNPQYSKALVPGGREGWKPFGVQLALESNGFGTRRMPELCAELIDSGGYTRILPSENYCWNRGVCQPTFLVTGMEDYPQRGRIAISGVRYSGLFVFGQVPQKLSPTKLTLYAPADADSCERGKNDPVWGEFDLTAAPAQVTFPFDELPTIAPLLTDEGVIVTANNYTAAISPPRFSPNEFYQDVFVLESDVTYNNTGGNDLDTTNQGIHALVVHESGQNIGLFDAQDVLVPPGMPKTVALLMDVGLDKAEYAGTWFYVLYLDGNGAPIAQAKVTMPADITWHR